MHTATGYARLNITLPNDVAEYVRSNAENMSKYIAEALHERIAREKREKAIKAILAGPPSFTDIDDSTAVMTRLDEELKAFNHRNFPRTVSKSVFLETLLEYGLDNLDAIRARIVTEPTESERTP